MYFVVLLNTLFCISHFTRSVFPFSWLISRGLEGQASLYLSVFCSPFTLTSSKHSHHFAPHFPLSFLLSLTCILASVFSKEGLTSSFVFILQRFILWRRTTCRFTRHSEFNHHVFHCTFDHVLIHFLILLARFPIFMIHLTGLGGPGSTLLFSFQFTFHSDYQ